MLNSKASINVELNEVFQDFLLDFLINIITCDRSEVRRVKTLLRKYFLIGALFYWKNQYRERNGRWNWTIYVEFILFSFVSLFSPICLFIFFELNSALAAIKYRSYLLPINYLYPLILKFLFQIEMILFIIAAGG